MNLQELELALAKAQAEGNKDEIDRLRDLRREQQEGKGWLDVEELAGPDESPKQGSNK